MEDNIILSSNAFKNGEKIPVVYTCDGKNISPGLNWTRVPPETESMVLIMDDPDAPRGTFVHWIVFNIPHDVQEFPEGMIFTRKMTVSRQGKTSFGGPGYGGPCPPPGKPHRYYFKIYALDIKLDLPAGVIKSDLEKAMNGHILAKGELMGTYGR